MKTDELIDNLLTETPRKPIYRPLKSFFKWLLYSIIYMLILAKYLNVSADIMLEIIKPAYLFEISVLILTVIMSILCCSYIAVPDVGQKNYLVFFPLISLTLLIAYIMFMAINMGMLTNFPAFKGVQCTSCIILSSLIPAAFIFYEIGKAAPTRLYLAGFFCLLYASSISALTLRLEEVDANYGHLIVWHYGPIIIISALGAFISNKILKW